MAYVPLHVHTEHSALDGLARLSLLAKAIADGGMEAGAITDHGSLAGLWEFSRVAKKHGVKPIPGMEAYLSIGSRHEPGTMQFYNDEGMGDDTDEVTGRLKRKAYYHLTILARNRTGWHNLILMHNASQKTKSGKHPMIDYELLKQYGEGITVLTGCLASPVAGPAAQTGVIAQLFLDELDLPSALGPDISDADIEELEHLLWEHLDAKSAARKDIAAQVYRAVQRIGQRLADSDRDALQKIIDTAIKQANQDDVNDAIDQLHDLAEATHAGADDDMLADIEDAIFDAIAAADPQASAEPLAELTQMLSELEEPLTGRNFDHLARQSAQLRSGVISSLLRDATTAVETASHPVAAKHPTIKADALQAIAHTDDHITVDTVANIGKAIDVIDHGNDRSRTAKKKKADRDDLVDMLYGIIEQAYVNELSDSFAKGLLFMLNERIKESTASLDNAYQATETLIDAVGKDNVFVEIMDHGITSEQYAMDHLVPLAEHFDLDLVVTNDSHYIQEDDAEAHDAFLAIGTGKSLDSPGRFAFNGSGYHVMNEAEVRAIHADDEVWQQAVSNTAKVADMVDDDTVPEPEMRLPTYPLPEDFDSADDYLRHLVEDKAPERYGDDWRDDDEVVERIDHELSVISDMGFSDYFLITWDIMDFCVRNEIATGPGRGSAAGSITSYILGIVHVCPLDNGLLFERFLERGRVGMPDIDLDFPKFQRWRIHQYVGEKYGHDHIAQIGSFQASKSRAAVRDAARVLTPDADGIETKQEADRRREIFRLGDELAKILEPPNGGDPTPFKDLDALPDNHPQKVEFYKVAEKGGEVGHQIVELARQMEGISKGLSIHPCGFVISTEPLTDMVPLRPGATENEPDIIIWDGDMCEDMGLLKMDFLAIQNLDYMDRTFEYLGEQGIEMTVHDIPHPNDDEESVDIAYELLREGRTAGLFQLDSAGMTEVVRNVAPNDLNDLSAVVALYRPGPLSAGMPADYAAKKRGDKAESYDHLSNNKEEVKWLDEVLGETYQAALYQEQAMLLGRVVAGFDDKQRSTLRRAIGRKDKSLMDQVKGWWFEGAGEEFVDDRGNVYSPVFSSDTAHKVWDFIEGAASYSFNKCITGDTVVKTSDSSTRTVEQLYRQIHGSGETAEGLCPSCLMRPARPLAIDEICAPCASWRIKLNDSRGFTLLAYDESDGRIRPQRMKTVHYNGEREVFKLTFSDGSAVRATDNHRFRMTDGYRYVSDMRTGDLIVSHEGNDSYENHLDTLRTTTGPRMQRPGNKPWLPGLKNSGYVDGGFVALREWTEKTIDTAACDECGKTLDDTRLERAHLDGNRRNNSPENLAWKCVSHHKKWDYRHNGRTKRWEKGHLSGTLEIVSIESVGIEPVYDVEMMEGTDHNFIANGVVSHNSHSAAYGMLAYWTAWLKANHPVEYSAAMLAVSDNEDKRLLVIKDLIAEGIPLQAPSINTSQAGSAPVDGEVHLGLAEIRDVGKAAELIITERDNNGEFSSLHDVATRVKGVNTRALRALIEAGAMDEFGPRRGLLKNLYAAKVIDLPVDDTEFGVVERDARQRIVIGTVVGSKTLDAVDLDDISDSISNPDGGFTLDVHRLDELDEDSHTVCHLGVVSGYKSFVSRSGRMAKGELSDSGSLPIVIFNDGYRDMLRNAQEPVIGDLMVVSGQVKTSTWVDDEGEEQSTQEILASRVWLPEDPTKNAETPWQTTMLSEALDNAGTADSADAPSKPVERPRAKETQAAAPSKAQRKPDDEDSESHAAQEPVDPADEQAELLKKYVVDIAPDGGWVAYIVTHLQPGIITEDSSRLISHVGDFRKFYLDGTQRSEYSMYPENMAVVIKHSGNLEQDLQLAERLLSEV